LKLVSWNVNGLRAVLRRNFLAYLDKERPDVLCLQETRTEPHEVESVWPPAYETFWNPAGKKGYAGTSSPGSTPSGSSRASAGPNTTPRAGC
jgi:exodeoxyribonuclease-3